MRFVILFLLIGLKAFGQSNQDLRFIENKGQWSSDVDFQALVPGGHLAVSSQGFSVLLLDMEEQEHRHLASHSVFNESDGNSEPINAHYFQINLLGANANSIPIVGAPLDGHYNYFLGNDSRQWASRALAYSSITYPDIYAGIDFRVSSVGSNLKYDFIVKPGADPSQIKIEYAGADGIEKVKDELKIRTIVGALTELEPFSYQSGGTGNLSVASDYQLKDNIVSFYFPDGYDTTSVLTIDPLLIFSTYSGSSADNWGSTATPGEYGTLYSAGVTTQARLGTFPATPGAFQMAHKGNFDMAIIKYDSAGTKFLYATIVGGINNDSPQSLVVDKNSGDLIVLGISSSPDFPTSTDAFDRSFNNGENIFNRVLNTTDQWDIVITRFSRDGDVLVGSTFLGGTSNDGLNLPKQAGGPLVVNYGDEMRGDVITDDAGFIYISSVTGSDDFPIVGGFDSSFGGFTDGVVVKLSVNLSSIVWSGYIGGSGFDASYSIKFDNANHLVLAGGTTSFDFPTTFGSYQPGFKGIVDGWIARVSASGNSIMNATYTGTNSFDQIYFVDLNGDGEIFCYGQTTGHMPVTPGVFSNVNSGQFLQKFSSDLSALKFSTVFGSGSSNGLVIPNISPTAFLVNDCDNIYMAGWGGFVNSETGFWESTTSGMPITKDAFQKATSGSDFYFIVLNGSASELVYSTYFGGNDSKTHVDGGTSRFDKYGIVYHAVCSGCAFGNSAGESTSDFPTTPGAKSRVNGSTNCNNAAFKFDLSSLRAMFDTNNLSLTMPGFNNVCYPDTVVFQNLSTGGRTIVWDFDDGTVLNRTDEDTGDILHQFKEAGAYKVKLKITDLSTCSQTDSITKVINYFIPEFVVGEDSEVCEGVDFQLTAGGGLTYEWNNSDKTFTSTAQNPFIRPDQTALYHVKITDVNGCVRKDTIEVAVLDSVKLQWQHQFKGNCTERPSVIVENLTVPEDDVTFNFDFGDGATSAENEVEHVYAEDGRYALKLRAQKKFCTYEETVQLPVYRLFVPNVFTPEVTAGSNDNFEIRFGPDLIAPGAAGVKIELIVLDRWGKKVFESQDYKNTWSGRGLASGVYYIHLKVGDFATCKNWLHIMK